MNILDIGCGKNRHPRSTGIDINSKSDADIIFDIEKGIPFPANQFDLVYSNHTLERLDPKKLIFVLEEIWRVIRKSGKIIITVPHFSGVAAYTNPSHRRFGFTSQTFSYFDSENEYENFGKISFKVEEVKLIKIKGNKNPLWVTFTKIITFLANLNITFCELFWVYWFGGFDEIRFVLKPKK